MKIEEAKGIAKEIDKAAAELGALILECKKKGLKVEVTYRDQNAFRPLTVNIFVNPFELEA